MYIDIILYFIGFFVTATEPQIDRLKILLDKSENLWYNIYRKEKDFLSMGRIQRWVFDRWYGKMVWQMSTKKLGVIPPKKEVSRTSVATQISWDC